MDADKHRCFYGPQINAYNLDFTPVQAVGQFPRYKPQQRSSSAKKAIDIYSRRGAENANKNE